MRKLYFSYGMNTNLEQMALRCPTANSLGAAVLPGFRFEFKSFATVTPDSEQDSVGVLWEIGPADESSLDILEGYPNYYDKRTVTVLLNDVPKTAMVYLMHPDEVLNLPTNSYLTMLEQGYTAHGIELEQLYSAIEQVHNEYSSASKELLC